MKNLSPTGRLAAVATALILALTGCSTGDADKATDKAADKAAAEVVSVDAEDYTAGPATIVAKRIDPAKTKKEKKKDGCKTYYTTGSRKGQCKTWKYKTVTETDDTDYLLQLDNGYEVDVDQATYDSYDVTHVYPRSAS